MQKATVALTVFLVGCLPMSDLHVAESHVTTLERSSADLEQVIAGKPAIVNFWASWCSFCKEEMPLLQGVYEENPGIAVTGINLQEERAVARAYVDAGSYTFPTLLDPAAELKKKYGVFTQPTTFVFDPDGKELYRKDGPFTEMELTKWVKELAAFVPGEAVQKMDAVDIPDTEVLTSAVPPLLAAWYEGEVRHSIPLDDILSGGPQKDDIPALDAPRFLLASAAPEEWNSLPGIFVSAGDDERFYPINILNWHEIVNDTIGGVPVSVTYCPLCASAAIYERTTSEGVGSFGVSGFLYESNLLMYDRITGSLWDQVHGEAVVGKLTGEKLHRIPSDVLTLATVRKKWPKTQVLSTVTGYVRQYNLNPYGGYDQVPSTYFPVSTVDERAGSKELVYGIVQNGVAKAYTVDAIRRSGSLQDTVGGTTVWVQYDPETERIRFFRMKNSGEKEELAPVSLFWFSWVAQYPDTQLYKDPEGM